MIRKIAKLGHRIEVHVRPMNFMAPMPNLARDVGMLPRKRLELPPMTPNLENSGRASAYSNNWGRTTARSLEISR